MLRIGLQSTGGTYNTIATYGNEPLNFALQFSDIENIQTSVGSFSQSFKLPFDDFLKQYLGFVDKPGYIPQGTDIRSNYTLFWKKRYPAALTWRNIPVVHGYIQFKGVTKTDGRVDVEGVFFAEQLDIAKQVGDKMLTDLDLSAYDHVLNYANVTGSWLGLGIGPQVRYGIIDKGFNWSVPDNPPWTSTDGIQQGELTPFIQAKALVDQIFTDAGLTYVSDFFDTADFGNIYLPAYNGSAAINTADLEDQTAAVGLNGDLTGGTTLNVLTMVDTIAQAVDPADNWTNAGGYKYTCAYTGYYDMRFSCKWEKTDPAHFVKIYLYKNGSSIATLVDTTQTSATYSGFPAYQSSGEFVWGPSVWSTGASGGALNNTYVFGQGFLFEAGDEIQIYRQTSGISAKIYGGGSFTPSVGSPFTTSLTFANVSAPLSGSDVNLSDNMPELKQMDLLLSLQKMFNLVFIPSGIPGQLIIEPWDDYFSTGDEVDWTQKVHRDKTITLRPTTDLQSRQYQWTYREGLDFISDAVEASLNRVYGAHRVLDPDNDFATGEQKVETSLGNYIVSLIPGSSFPIHRSLQQDGSAVDNPLAMLAYWGGTVTTFGECYIRNDVGTTVGPISLFPLFSPYSADYPTLTDNDLNFGMEASFIPQECNPLNTLYYKYWKTYVRELYSEEARIMECTINFYLIDFQTFKWNTKVFIDDTWWRVLSVNTDLNGNGTAKVRLMKVLPSSTDCVDTPTSYDSKPNVIFFNGSTIASPDFGSEECCTRYGYRWVANSVAIGGVTPLNVCKPKNQAIQPQ
jgi:hypothetical protein